MNSLNVVCGEPSQEIFGYVLRDDDDDEHTIMKPWYCPFCAIQFEISHYNNLTKDYSDCIFYILEDYQEVRCHWFTNGA